MNIIFYGLGLDVTVLIVVSGNGNSKGDHRDLDHAINVAIADKENKYASFPDQKVLTP